MLQSFRSAAKYIWIIIILAFIGGFLLFDTSGLIGRGPVTNTTVVATVEGTDIPYLAYETAAQNAVQAQEQRMGRSLSLDEIEQVRDQTFEQMVTDILLQKEYARRGIQVTESDIQQAAQMSPPPELMQSPELQTEGRFDIEKYRRFLRSPAARTQGLLIQLENYYREAIRRAKLMDQLVADVYVSDERLWSAYQDANDTARVTYVRFDPTSVADSAVRVSDAELRAYYDRNRAVFERPGRAVVSVLAIPRTVTAADSTAIRARVVRLRDEIVSGGSSFADVARRESADSVSAAQGGSLGIGGRNRFAEEFEKAAYALRVGEISQPVLTQFGYHLIRLDQRKGDSITPSHILLRIQQSDSSALRTDRRADSLARLAAEQNEPARLDSAAKVLGLEKETLTVVEGQPLFGSGGALPGVAAWAFGGVEPGETSSLLDSEGAYYLARLDSLTPSGTVPFTEVRDEIRSELLMRAKIQALIPRAAEFASAALKSSLEGAAQSAGLTVEKSDPFTRGAFAGSLGRINRAIGAAFGLPVGGISAPVATDEAVFVLRVDRRVEASRAEFDSVKSERRERALAALRDQRVRAFFDALRKNADVEDNRAEIAAAARRQTS
ncbi:MAG: peptidyl-prolyl cis-trans isomerase [Gemmatimonadaceae bacterium]